MSRCSWLVLSFTLCSWFGQGHVLAGTLLFDRGAVWRWRPGTNEASVPVEAWRLAGFNDAEFTAAPAPFWYGDVLSGGTQISGMQGIYSCVFLRKTFTIANPNELTALRLGALVDDGLVAWINGVEVARVSMFEPAGSPVSVSTLAANAIEPVAFLSYTLTNISTYLVAGANELAVQVFQSSLSSSDLGFDCALESIPVDVDSPRLIAVQPAPGSTLSNLLQVTVTFDEPVDGVDAGDLLINGGPANAVSALNERTFLFSFSQPAYGGVQFSWRATHGIQDQAVPPNAFDAADPSALWSYTLIDRTPPAVAGIDPASGAVVRSLNSINILFNEPVSGVNAGDLLINQTPATGLTTLAPNQYLFTFQAPPTGLVTVAWAPAVNIIDAAGNALAGGNWTYQFDPNAGGDLPYISELMASNTRTLADENNEFSDWIEIHNPGAEPVDLEGWALTDDPARLQRWRFPATNLAGGDYLVVFASGKDRRIPGAPLHTDFRLSASGEYLALVQPDGTITSEFSPTFPPQVPDVSYGFGLLSNQRTLIPLAAPVRVLVPGPGNGGNLLGDTWTGGTNGGSFDDSAWRAGVLGVGFAAGANLVASTSLVVRFAFDAAPVGTAILDSKPTGTPRNGVNVGAAWVASSTDAAPTPRSRSGVMQFNAAEGDQIKLAPQPEFNSARGTISFWMRSAGAIGVGSYGAILFDRRANTYTGPGDVIVMQDDGRLFVQAGNGSAGGINAFATTTAVNDDRWHHVAYVYDQTSSGSIAVYVDGVLAGRQNNSAAWSWSSTQEIELGRSYDAFWRRLDGFLDDFRIYNRPLTQAEIAQVVAGDSGVAPSDLGTDLRTDMLNINASAFVRIPFVVEDPFAYSLLTLLLKYDDGYVAWINGVEVGRANAPANLAWNSAATGTHPASSAEVIRLGNPPGLLRPGTNILAIQGLNLNANDQTFLIYPQLTGTSIASAGATGVYFISPTSGGPNSGGSTTPGPIISSVQHTPNVPKDAEDLTVTARIQASFAPVASVTMHYRIMFDTEASVPMFDDGGHGDGLAGDGLYGAVIPANLSTNGQMIRYYVLARDVSGNGSRWPLFTDPANTAEYLGTIVDPTNVVSKLPIVHLFVSPSQQSAVDGQSGGRASVFYDGEFYDNVQMQVRGNTTAGYVKKSHRVEFNREHTFRHPGPGGRVRKTSFMAEFIDPSYVRQYLSFWLLGQVGHNTPYHYPVRLQQNGVFYQLAFHSEVLGEEQASRYGFDPRGAIYKACGVVAVSPCSTGGGPEKLSREQELGMADYTALASAVANTLPVAQRRTNLFDIIDIPDLINYLAVSRLSHEQDDIWANLSLYRDSDGDRMWRVLPFDLNLSWGQLYGVSNVQATNDSGVSHPFYGASTVQIGGACGGFNHLLDAVVQVPETRQMFLRRLRTVMETFLQPPGTPNAERVIEGEVRAVTNLLYPEAILDRQRWGWATGGGPGALPSEWLTNGVASLFNQFLNPRRVHLFVNHSITNTSKPLGLAVPNNAGIPVSQPPNVILRVVSLEANPASGRQEQEYLCLSNPAPFAVDISGWKVEGGIDFTFKPGTVVASNGLIFLSPDLIAFRARTASPHGGQALFVVGPYHGQLSARGEEVRLLNSTGQAVDTYAYPGAPSVAQQFLRVTEVMYHPSPHGASPDPEDFEFIELRNISSTVSLDLNGVRLTNAVGFSFTGSAISTLPPGGRVLVVKNAAAFRARYGTGLPIAGQFTGFLDNDGERIQLLDARNEEILDFHYDDDWYPITDGLGFSLVIVDETAEPDAWDHRAQWRPSGVIEGSPGQNKPPLPNLPAVLITEALSRTDHPPPTDSIELHNPGSTPADISGWWLTDDFNTPQKFRVPAGTVIAAGGYRVFTEADFNPANAGFALGADGDEVWLFSADVGGLLTGYVHGYRFGAADDGVSFGRYVTSDNRDVFVAQTTRTLGSANSGPRVGPVVINEIHYHPPDIGTNDNQAEEFIELLNITGDFVDLFDRARSSITWRVQGGIGFTFPAEITLSANESVLLVNFDPVADPASVSLLQQRYNIPAGTRVFGPYHGHLNNSDDQLVLEKPTDPVGSAIPYVLVDGVHYRDETPWPAGADGYGLSLQRKVANAFGDDPGNWTAAPPSAGRPTSAGGNVPTITSQPQPASVLSGETLSLTVGAQGSAPLFYQWRRNGANIAGATNAALTLPAITPAQAGDYNVVVYNQAGSAVSSNATVSVRLTLVILQQPRSVATNAGGNVSFSVLAYSPGPVSYQWLKDDQELAGAISSSLSISNVQPSAAGAYVVRMTDQYGTYRSAPATLLVLVPPLIVQQPLSQSVLPGDMVVLSVTVTNTATLPITALWRRNGTFFQTNTFQSTNAFLVITNAQPPFTNYQAVITNLARILGFPTTNAFLTFLTDSDGDGLPDAWETTYFNDPSSADPDADPDGDSMSNRAEYLAGTDPTDPSSYLRIDAATAAPGAILSFLARPQRTYTVEYSDNLAPGSWWKLADFGAVPSTRVQFATDPSYLQATNRLYRLVTPRRP